MDGKTNIQELSPADLDKVSGGNMAQKDIIRRAQAALAAMKMAAN